MSRFEIAIGPALVEQPLRAVAPPFVGFASRNELGQGYYCAAR